MDPAFLKREFGRDLVFWGGTDSQKTLPFGAEAEVRAMVRGLVDTLAPGGGFVFSSCHNIQPDVPLENVLAMFDEARNHAPDRGR
jgi:uroporphyrinogen decarboxylase